MIDQQVGMFLLAYEFVGFVLGVFFASMAAKEFAREGHGPGMLVLIVISCVFVWPALLLKMWADQNDRWTR